MQWFLVPPQSPLRYTHRSVAALSAGSARGYVASGDASFSQACLLTFSQACLLTFSQACLLTFSQACLLTACPRQVDRCLLTDELTDGVTDEVTDELTDELTDQLDTFGVQVPNSIISFAFDTKVLTITRGAPTSQFYLCAPASLMHSRCLLPRHGFGTCSGHFRSRLREQCVAGVYRKVITTM